MTINSDTAHKAPKMLIADDDAAIVQMLANRCLHMGFKVDTASNGMQLLIKARQWKPDVLIVDVNMPELDGLSVCAKLLEPLGISVDVVVVTGYTDSETIERCESFGAFYARKGPDFWIRIRAALEELFPHMADKIEEVAVQATNGRVPEHPRVLVVDDDSNTEKVLPAGCSNMAWILCMHRTPCMDAGLPARRSQASSLSTISYRTATQSIFCIDCAAHRRPRAFLSS